MKTIEIRPDGTRRVYTRNEEPSKTDPSQAQQSDVNFIMARYKKTGQLTHLARKQGVYADVSEISDLLEATQKVERANEAFMSIPAELRDKLNHDPKNLIDFLNNPENDELAIMYGLKTKKEELNSSPVTEPITTPKSKTKTQQQSKKQNDDELNDDE